MEAYERAGLHRVYLGDEAVLELTGFDIEAKGRQHARRGWNRGRRDGLQAEVRRSGTLDAATVAELVELSDRWRGGAAERGLLDVAGPAVRPAGRRLRRGDRPGRRRRAGRLPQPGAVGTGRGEPGRDAPGQGRPQRRQRVPDRGGGPAAAGARRHPALAELRLPARADHGRRRAPGRRCGPGCRPGSCAGWTRWFQIESLYLFNQKFGPDWVPRYCAVQSLEDLPRVAIAMGRAEGFVESPVRLPWRRRPTGTPSPAGSARAAGEVGGAAGRGARVRRAGGDRRARSSRPGPPGRPRRRARRAAGPRRRPAGPGRGPGPPHGRRAAAEPGGAGAAGEARPAAGRRGGPVPGRLHPHGHPGRGPASAGSGWPRARRPTTRSGSPGGSCSGTRSAG